MEIDILARMVYTQTFDALVYTWDRWLFTVSPHELVEGAKFWSELFHFFYLTYYFVLIAGVLYSGYTNNERARFILLGSFMSFVLMFIAFPVAGPHIYPEFSMMSSGFFPYIVSLIYTPVLANGSFSGAFPSSHMGMAVIIALLYPKYWKPALIILAGIAISTVYGQFHYAIDTVAGIVAGILLFYMWSKIYDFFNTTYNT